MKIYSILVYVDILGDDPIYLEFSSSEKAWNAAKELSAAINVTKIVFSKWLFVRAALAGKKQKKT